MKALIANYKLHFGDKEFLLSFLGACLLFALAIVANAFAGSYAAREASNSVTDIILSNIRVYDIDGFFIYGPIVFWFFIGIFCLFNLRKFPFVMKSVALFIIIRSFFITLTHIGIPPQHVNLSLNFIERFVSGSGADLFFSSHTGMPFLIALIFWKQRIIRYIALLATFSFGTAALLGHFHYSIDVFSAFFITYSIFHIAILLFAKDRKMFLAGAEESRI